MLRRQILYKPICASTNRIALQLIRAGQAVEGTTIITDHQYAGQGQLTNTWVTTPGHNLTFSVIITPTFLATRDHFALNMMAALALRDAIAPYITYGLRVKWPNDIYHQQKKLAGIRIDSLTAGSCLRAAVVGIGCNVNQRTFTLPTATSLVQVCKRTFRLEGLLHRLLDALEAYYTCLRVQGISALHTYYLSQLYGFYQSCQFRDDQGVFRGVIRGVHTTGQLIVERAGDVRCYAPKEISLLM
ncbi:MAG: biotin--[acetyl-CoA-carboxylase] ligase [Bacteroidota bacterium]